MYCLPGRVGIKFVLAFGLEPKEVAYMHVPRLLHADFNKCEAALTASIPARLAPSKPSRSERPHMAREQDDANSLKWIICFQINGGAMGREVNYEKSKELSQVPHSTYTKPNMHTIY